MMKKLGFFILIVCTAFVANFLPVQAEAAVAPFKCARIFGVKHFGQLVSLHSGYRGEEKGRDVWVFVKFHWERAFFNVEYLNESERAKYEVFIKDGRLYDINNALVNTHQEMPGDEPARTTAIFVLSADGRLFLTTDHSLGSFHHSSFMAGAAVAFAGEIRVEAGKIKKITNKSGHYRTPAEFFGQLISELEAQHAELEGMEVKIYRREFLAKLRRWFHERFK